MKFRQHFLHASQTLDVGTLAGDSFHLSICEGRQSSALIPAGWHSIVLVLSGQLGMESTQTAWTLANRHCQVWVDGRLRAALRTSGCWLCVTAPCALWQRFPVPAHLTPNLLLPSEFRASPRLIRQFVQTIRPLTPNNHKLPQKIAQFGQLRVALIAQQHLLRENLQRCAGRTPARRHHTLLRLLRVQHLIRFGTGQRLDLQQLAASANYSPTHLIRVYRDVFGETPSEFAARLRQQRAWEMVRDTSMSIGEISSTLGFESESAFCRAFKQAFGMTTGVARKVARQGLGER